MCDLRQKSQSMTADRDPSTASADRSKKRLEQYADRYLVAVTSWCAMQMRSKKDFVHEEDVKAPRRLGWRNVVEGLELHKNLLSPAEQDIFTDAIRRWEEEGRAVGGTPSPGQPATRN